MSGEVRRVCGAILRGDLNDSQAEILMVRHRNADHTYWTLPGGSVEAGETPEEGAVREAREETGLETLAVWLLWEIPHHSLTPGWVEQCFLLDSIDPKCEPSLGFDPEEAHLPVESRLLVEVAWVSLAANQNDAQVSKVIKALKLSLE